VLRVCPRIVIVLVVEMRKSLCDALLVPITPCGGRTIPRLLHAAARRRHAFPDKELVTLWVARRESRISTAPQTKRHRHGTRRGRINHTSVQAPTGALSSTARPSAHDSQGRPISSRKGRESPGSVTDRMIWRDLLRSGKLSLRLPCQGGPVLDSGTWSSDT